MRALVDVSGWPEALSYYRMFPHEPSASSALDIRIDEAVAIRGINLEKVLDEMISAGENDETEALIVAHGTVAEGNPGGFSMPLAGGSDVSAMRDEVRAVTQAAIAIQEAPSDPLGWARFIEDADTRRRVQESATREQAPGLLEQWLQARAESLGMNRQRLLELIAKRNTVAARRFQRIEIRACNLGTFPEAMQALREFFGADRLLAPRVITLYGKAHLSIIEDLNQYQEWLQSRGGAGTGSVFPEMEGAFGRSFGEAFCLRIERGAGESYEFELDAAALSEQAALDWVDAYIMQGSTYSGRGDLFVGAFWTFGQPGLPQPYVLPGDAEYRTIIVSDPP